MKNQIIKLVGLAVEILIETTFLAVEIHELRVGPPMYNIRHKLVFFVVF
jgi:hypothetical protein